ncbi:MAG: enoyl-CoA hydratase/isomerase family protein [Rhodobacteraceae bacterium]|nr:enoyl-CoA hydratase/isomerase family protein [Paracoccaceae bacterium]
MAAFDLTQSGGIAHLQFCQPKTSNAMGIDFWADFLPAITALNEKGSTRVLVISAQGKNFCSGMDLAAFAGGIPETKTPLQREAFPFLVGDLQKVLSALETARFPVIAAIQGACIGGGLDLVSACDLRFASENAYFRIEETNIGMMADLGSLQRLPKLMPEGLVRELAYLGNTLSAERAYAAGFVNVVETDFDATLSAAMQAAERIAGQAPMAITGSKSAITYARDHSIEDSLRWASTMQAMIWNPDDIGKAVMARVKKETAEFEDLKPIPQLKP